MPSSGHNLKIVLCKIKISVHISGGINTVLFQEGGGILVVVAMRAANIQLMDACWSSFGRRR
jgi:hypothetical protein